MYCYEDVCEHIDVMYCEAKINCTEHLELYDNALLKMTSI